MLDTPTDSDAAPDSSPGPRREPASLPLALLLGTWALAVVGLAQAVLALTSILEVLTGGLDEQYFTEYDYSGDPSPRTDVTFWERWDVVTWTVPVDHVLLASAAVVVALAGLHLAGRGRWRLPLPLRLVASGAGAVTTTISASHVVLALAGTQREQDETYGNYGWPSEFVSLATPVATAAAVAVFAGLAVVVLFGPAAPVALATPDPRPDPTPDPTQAPGSAEEAPAETAPATPTEPVPGADVVEFPRPNEEDYACYRRPPA